MFEGEASTSGAAPKHKPAPGQGSYYPVGNVPDPTQGGWKPDPINDPYTADPYTGDTSGGGVFGGGDNNNPYHSGGSSGGGSSSGGGTYSGSVPSIDEILGSDAAYQALLAFDTAASGEDLATMNARIAKMQGYYGSDTDPLSILGRVFQAYKDRNMYIANTLTGHGMIDSGETGWQGARSTLAYQQQELDARMKLQDFIDGLNDAYRAAERQRKFNELSASWDAINKYLDTHPPTQTGG